jgi:hypothetical protein
LEDEHELEIIAATNSNDLCRALISLTLRLKFRRKYLFVMESAHQYTDLCPNLLEKNRKFLRLAFNPVSYKGSEQIVIHLRRGQDLTANQRLESDEVLYARITALLQKHPGQKIRIYTNEQFVLRKGFQHNVIVDFSSNPFEAMSHMTQADILIIAKSSLSYVAGLINSATVYYPHFWHPKMKNWKLARELE